MVLERRAAAEAIAEHPDTQVWMWERSAHAGPYPSLEVCRGNAATSDILILIVSDTLTEACEIEWRAAREAGATCALFAKASVSRDANLAAFLRAEKDYAVFVEYDNKRDLKKRIGETLRRSHTSELRKGVLQRRRLAQVGALDTCHLFEVGLEKAEEQLWSGSAVSAGEIVKELEVHFGSQEVHLEDLDLMVGRVNSVLGETERAAAAYERVVARPNHSPIGAAIAQQNLSLEVFRRRDFRGARDLMMSAFELHRQCENWFGVLQMLLNFSTLAVTEGDLESALKLAGKAEYLIGKAGGPLPQQSVSVQGLRGLVAAYEGRPADALKLYRWAWRKSKTLGDRASECVYSQNIGSAYADLDRPSLAAKWYESALVLAKEAGNARRQEELHGCLAVVAHRLGDHVSSLENFEAARAFASRIGDGWRVGTLTADIGAILLFLDSPRAAEELDRAAKLLGELRDEEWLLRVERNRSALARRAGDRARADAALRRALEVASGDDARRDLHEALAAIYLDKPVNEATAVKEFQLAADCATKAGPADRAWLLWKYAVYLTKVRCPAAALGMFDQAIGVGRSAGDADVLFHIRNDRGLALADIGQLAAAQDVFRDGVSWARSKRKRALELQALHNLGEIQRRTGDLVQSRKSLKRAVHLSEKVGDFGSWRAALGLLAMTELGAGSLDIAKQLATQLRDAARLARDVPNEATATGTLAGIEFVQGNFLSAARSYRAASRLEPDDPVRRCEDLMGVLESFAAASNWRRTQSVAQEVVHFAEAESLENIVWPSLLRAARSYLNRGKSKHAGILAAPAVLLAINSGGPNQIVSGLGIMDHGPTSDGPQIPAELVHVVSATSTLAIYVKLAQRPSAHKVWEVVLNETKKYLGPAQRTLRSLIDESRKAAEACDAQFKA